MAVQSKTTVKSYFQTGDKPTQAQFEDLIDSYQDAATALSTLVSAANNSLGIFYVPVLGEVSASPVSDFGRTLINASAAASARSDLGLGVLATVSAVSWSNLDGASIATTAQAVAGTAANLFMNPVTTRAAIEANGGGDAFATALLHIRDQVTAGTNGAALVANTWNKRDLQTVMTNEIASASLSSSVISLPAGTYWCDSEVCVSQGGSFNYVRHRLRDTTNSADLVLSGTDSPENQTNFNKWTPMEGRFTLAGTTNIELQTFMPTGATGRAGFAANIDSKAEIYAEICIWRVA